MPIFKFGAHIAVSAYTEVEAESLEEALEIAKGRDAALGGIGSGAYADESWIVDDIDGSPQNIHIED